MNRFHLMKTTILSLMMGGVMLPGFAQAQSDIPLLRPEERQAVDQQTDEFNQSIAPALTDAAKSTVRIWAGKRRMAYGTVIGNGDQILTKWSEVARAHGNLRVEAADGVVAPATITGVYEEEDLAVLEIRGSRLTPVKWSDVRPALGGFLIAPQPDGRPAAFGVVSVLERNLRETDRAYLGVFGSPDFKGPGVKIHDIAPDSPAAAVGLQPGDVILKVGKRTISGVMELKSSLVDLSPGTTVTLQVLVGKDVKNFDILLANRPQLPNILGDRLQQMERMGGAISQVRDSFSRAIQTDMRPKPDQIGGPVVNLQGKVIGITMARADRTRSFIMPSAAVEELLKKPAQDPAIAQAHQAKERAEVPVTRITPPGGMRPGGEDRMRRHLSEMQRLMEFMREEMDSLEQGR
jgi:S1-C subfamily serine protease